MRRLRISVCASPGAPSAERGRRHHARSPDQPDLVENGHGIFQELEGLDELGARCVTL